MANIYPVIRSEDICNIDGDIYTKIMFSDGHIEIIPHSYNFTTPSTLDDSGIFKTIPSFNDYHKLYKAGVVNQEEFQKVMEAWEEDMKGGPETKVYTEKTPQSKDFIVTCNNIKDLSPEHVLKNLSKIKGKLMLICAPIHVDHFVCKMTPEVKKNIITAYKKLNMYGKKLPIIARFDDYGNRLPDEINIDTLHGVELRIINSNDYGPYYFEIKAICKEYESKKYVTEEDLPF